MPESIPGEINNMIQIHNVILEGVFENILERTSGQTPKGNLERINEKILSELNKEILEKIIQEIME